MSLTGWRRHSETQHPLPEKVSAVNHFRLAKPTAFAHNRSVAENCSWLPTVLLIRKHTVFPCCHAPITTIYCGWHSERPPRPSNGRLSSPRASIKASPPRHPGVDESETPSELHLNPVRSPSHLPDPSPLGSRPAASSPVFLLLPSCSERKRRRRRLMDVPSHRASNAVWPSQATEMSSKWCSTPRFVISLIKFAGDPLPPFAVSAYGEVIELSEAGSRSPSRVLQYIAAYLRLLIYNLLLPDNWKEYG